MGDIFTYPRPAARPIIILYIGGASGGDIFYIAYFYTPL